MLRQQFESCITDLQRTAAQHSTLPSLEAQGTRGAARQDRPKGFHQEPTDLSDIRSLLQSQNVLIQQLTYPDSKRKLILDPARIHFQPQHDARSTSGTTEIVIRLPSISELEEAFQAILHILHIASNEILLRLVIILPFINRLIRTAQSMALAPTMLLRDNILFEDALGRKASLPFQYFQHFPVFMARLQCEFKGLPGERRVIRKQFRLFDAERSDIPITEKDWQARVVPGASLSMAVVVNNAYCLGTSCPRCYAFGDRVGKLEWEW